MKVITKNSLGWAVAGLVVFMLVSRASNRQNVVASAAAGMDQPSPASAGSSYVRLFNGSRLDGWHSLGAGTWRAENGELVGAAQSSAGGWLIANDGYQDFVLHVAFECTQCDAGVLVRGAKSGAGMTGIYVPLSGAEVGRLYRVALSGNEEKLGNLTPMPIPPAPVGFQGNIDAGPCAPINCDGIRDAHGGSEGHPSAAPPRPGLHSGWNDLAITMRGDVISAGINGTPLAQAEMDDGPWYG